MSCCCIFMKVKTIFVFQRNINIKFIGEKSTVFIIEDTGNILFLYNFLKNISFHFMSEWENRFFFWEGGGETPLFLIIQGILYMILQNLG